MPGASFTADRESALWPDLAWPDLIVRSVERPTFEVPVAQQQVEHPRRHTGGHRNVIL